MWSASERGARESSEAPESHYSQPPVCGPLSSLPGSHAKGGTHSESTRENFPRHTKEEEGERRASAPRPFGPDFRRSAPPLRRAGFWFPGWFPLSRSVENPGTRIAPTFMRRRRRIPPESPRADLAEVRPLCISGCPVRRLGRLEGGPPASTQRLERHLVGTPAPGTSTRAPAAERLGEAVRATARAGR